MSQTDSIAKARRVQQTNAARRAASDPVRLAKACRVVAAGLEGPSAEDVIRQIVDAVPALSQEDAERIGALLPRLQ